MSPFYAFISCRDSFLSLLQMIFLKFKSQNLNCCHCKFAQNFFFLSKVLQLNWYLPMYKVLGGLGGKGFKIRGYQHVVIISPKKKKKRTFSFSHTRRQGNCVAHSLAKRVRVSLSLLVWMEYVLPDIYEFFVSDFTLA